MSQFKHLYRTNRWRKLSEQFRARNPLCVMCMKRGRFIASQVCDHVLGHPDWETERMFWVGPFQALCKECHDSDKKKEESHKIQPGCDNSGVPTDPRSHWAK
jgi:hypothetical protein